ncbi:NAD-dependent epimerase/dehydratase family protein [Polymorphum gilvum]|uniref:NAD dependent epimerase/dehydratase family n=1 Tax=Polymorphum gilvum (strain LMG 25793 / CGMCC 1.9160 / SL003B-26A1) TaxID=991905 RepID=F2IUZ1_POLGS|nr:NAD(P)-dependent oxidoreductase [Polymorphum gilvum]ADZ70220.1 NAD dependent epimerase/dehydratase family [Polymorphum gilvum SL003B-26A1]
MRILLTGGTGQVGRFVAARLARDGHDLVFLGRRAPDAGRFVPWDLADDPMNLPAADALVHCALQHVPGRFRGGEGDDPEQFVQANLEGSERLFAAAKAVGIGRCVFLSSRAVYGDGRCGETLREDDPAEPDTLYGRVKLEGERRLQALCDDGFCGLVLRATGVYGLAPGTGGHKWQALFADYLAGRAIEPRRASEVHGEDLAAAVALLLGVTGPAAGFGVWNVSDLSLDRHDLLALVKALTGCRHALPARAQGPAPGVMATERLQALGWRGGGQARLAAFVRSVAETLR